MKGQQDYFGNHCHAVPHPASTAAPSLWRRWRRWLQLARERRELLRMSDEALKDLGLSRADIFQEASGISGTTRCVGIERTAAARRAGAAAGAR